MNHRIETGRNVVLFNAVAVLAGLLVSTALLAFMGTNPFEITARTLGRIFSDPYTMGEIVVKATPLVFMSLAFAFTYKANLFNIGAQGQFYMGSMAAVWLSLLLGNVLPRIVLLPLILVLCACVGAVAGGLIGYTKARRNSNEFLVSMMSTYVISALMDYLLRTALQETKAEYMQTNPIPSGTFLSIIIPGTRIHTGFILALAAAVGVWVFFEKTALGFRIRAVGRNRNAAELGGIDSSLVFVVSFLIAGGLAGMAGLTEINGVQHMLLRNFNSSIGSFGIGIAILANANPIGCIFASLLFGFLNVVGTTMGRLPGTSIPASLVELIEGIVMVCVILATSLRIFLETSAQKRKLRQGGRA